MNLRGPVVGACPHCEGAMRQVKSENVTFSACEGCGRVGITPENLNRLMLQDDGQRQHLLQDVCRFRPELMKKVHADPVCHQCRVPMYSAPLGMLTQEPVCACPHCYGLLLEHEILEDILMGQRRQGKHTISLR